MGQERQPGGRQHRLGRRQRQRPQPGALTADQDDGVHLRGVDGIRQASAVLSPFVDCVLTTSRERTSSAPLIVHLSGACHRLWMPISQESVGARVVGGQVAGGVAAGGVALVVQNLRRRNVHVLPTGPAEAISQVDVFHIHEVALVETRHLIEGGPPQQQARSRQPADRTFAGLEPVLPVGRRPRVGPPQRADDRVHAAADQAGQMPRRRVDRAVRVADQRAERRRPVGQRSAASSSASMLPGPHCTSGLATTNRSRSRNPLRSSATARFTAVP